MKIRYFVPAMLLIAVASSGIFAKTGTEQTQQKPIAPFTKKSEAQVKLAPRPAPVPLPASPGHSLITSRNYLGLELGLTSSLFFNAENYFVGANYDNDLTDEFVGLVPVTFEDYQPGLGYMAHAILDLAINETMGFQAKVGYRNHTMGATGRDTVSFDGGFTATAVENDYTATLNYAAVDALFRYQFMQEGLYGLAGFGFSSLLSNRAEGSQDDVNSDALGTFEGEFDDYYNSSRFDIKLGVGTWVPMGENGVVLAPELMVGLPLTGLFTSDINDEADRINVNLPNMLYASFGIAIKFPLLGSSSSGSYTSTSSSDSYEQETPEPGKAILRGRVIDNAGEPIDDAIVTVVDLNSNEVVATDETDDGIYNVKVNAPGRYSVTADAPGYLFGSAYFEVDKDGRILRHSGDIKLAPTTDGRVRLLIFFDFDKATLQSSSYPELNRAVALMKANPSMEVEIAGYTDAQGTDAYNKDLSQRRANTVRDYLVRQGIESSRVTAMGYGEANPVATNDTDDGRAENRRVEFVVKRR